MVQQLGPFQVVRPLGQGGMGAVFEVRRAGDPRRLALKLLQVPEPELRLRFAREGELLARLRHPGIIPVHESGQLPDGRPYLLMSLVEGTSLRERLREGRLAPEEALRLGQSLAAALGYAHAQGIVHRDVKPENLLFDAQGRLLVVDFGLARSADTARLTQTGELGGTPHYAAPEQLRGLAEAGPPADVWAVGAVLYEALTGRRPFEGKSITDLMLQVEASIPPPLRDLRPQVGPALAALVERCLEKDPARRYADGAALVAALQEAALGRGPASRVPSTPLALAGLAVVLGLAAWLDARGGPPPPRSPSLVTVTPDPAPAVTSAAPQVSPPSPRTPPREWVNERDGSRLVWIPPGSFTMEEFGREVTFSRGFYLGLHEVTRGQWRRYCAARSVLDDPRGASGPGAGEDDPVAEVSHVEARAYCEWAGLRLPSEAEWEYAARGAKGRRFPWGDELPAGHCNGRGQEDGWERVAPVGSFPRGNSPLGCQDLAGNVAEWVQDGFTKPVLILARAQLETDPLRVTDPAPEPPQHPDRKRVFKGGHYDSPVVGLGSTSRDGWEETARAPTVGFRVARDAE